MQEMEEVGFVATSALAKIKIKGQKGVPGPSSRRLGDNRHFEETVAAFGPVAPQGQHLQCLTFSQEVCELRHGQWAVNVGAFPMTPYFNQEPAGDGPSAREPGVDFLIIDRPIGIDLDVGPQMWRRQCYTSPSLVNKAYVDYLLCRFHGFPKTSPSSSGGRIDRRRGEGSVLRL